MMTFGKLLHEKKDAILTRWFEDALATYPAESSAAFKRQKDPFANPVGQSLRVAMPAIFEVLLDGAGPDVTRIREDLHEILKIRAVQEFSASKAVGFVFRLKETIRAELREAVEDPRFVSEWAKLDGQIDRIGLAAFDVFVECREQVCELRINEVKRSVSWVADRANRRGCCDPGSARAGPG